MLRRVIVMAMLSALACAPAYAQNLQWNEGRVGAQQSPPPQQPDGRPGPRQKGGERPADDGTRRSALTPDERRELNRDLQRANREIYRKGRDK